MQIILLTHILSTKNKNSINVKSQSLWYMDFTAVRLILQIAVDALSEL